MPSQVRGVLSRVRYDVALSLPLPRRLMDLQPRFESRWMGDVGIPVRFGGGWAIPSSWFRRWADRAPGGRRIGTDVLR